MPDLKISQLPPASTPLAGTELVPIVQGGVTEQTTVQAILTGTVPSGTANGVLYLNGSKVVTSGSGLTFDGTSFTVGNKITLRSDSPFLTGANLTSGANPLAIGGGAGNSVVAFFVNNAEQMRLTSTGLGIGTSSPVSKLSIIDVNRANSTNIGNINVYTSTAQATDVGATISLGGFFSAGSYAPFGSIRGGKENSTDNNYDGYLAFQTIKDAGVLSEKMRLDSSGNLGLGMTPSAWAANWKALQIGQGHTALVGRSDAIATYYGSNWLYDGAYKYIASGFASVYTQQSGQHIWLTAPSWDGTGSNAISFSQVMTLDASGNLSVGTTAISGKFTSSTAGNAAYSGWFDSSATTGTLRGLRIKYSGQSPNDAGNAMLVMDDSTAVRAQFNSNGGLSNYQANDSNLSDRREKTNFAPAKSYLDTICAIPVQTFNYIDQNKNDPSPTLGVVAQDVQAVAPELVMESNWGTENNSKMRLSIYQTDMQYALMKCIQELKAQNDNLRARVESLEA